MGSCLSKKGSTTTTTTTTTPVTPPFQPILLPIKTASKIVHGNAAAAAIEPPEEYLQGNLSPGHENFTLNKEVFLIKHGKTHDRDSPQTSPVDQKSASGISVRKSPDETPQVTRVAAVHTPDNHDKKLTVMRTSSCTKEELDAILIQCGRLSRSSSGNLGGTSYSGSKRSYDFDNHDHADCRAASGSVPRGCQFPDSNDEDDLGRRRPHRRQSRPSPTRDQGGRRRTPSRERDQQRSSSASRERRMSRSPGRRADNTTNASLSNGTANGGGSKLPAKMVPIPATVNGTDQNKSKLEPKAAAVKRISAKRNLGAGSTASPRSQSPVKQTTSIAKAADNDIQQPSLSRSSSRKAEKSPYRRNPLGEIDPSTFSHSQSAALLSNHKCHATANKENEAPLQVKAKLCIDKRRSEIPENTCALEEGEAAAAQVIPQKEPIVQASTTVGVDPEDIHQALARIKSSQEFGVEKDHHHHQGSYTSLLLQDIQKFHQNQAGPSSFSLPPCVVKACSIYDAVAGLNSKRSCIYNDPTAFSSCLNIGTSFMSAKSEAKDPFVESELAVDDDLVEPSILKYVTVKRGGMLGKEDEEQESSGSNTLFLGSAGAGPGLAMADSPNCGTSISAGTRMSAISGKVLLYG